MRYLLDTNICIYLIKHKPLQVFDTNIWISGLLWRGKPYQCLLLARTGMIKAVYCSEMVASGVLCAPKTRAL